MPLGAKAPAKKPEDIYTGWTVDTIHFALNRDLATWAFETTKRVPLEDSPAMGAFPRLSRRTPAARQAPSVQRGDTLASSTYWHGALMNRWANSWVKLYAGESANFVTTNMEDTGTLTALGRLGALGLADPERVLVLRTVSTYSMPPAGRDAAWSSTAPYPDQASQPWRRPFRVGSKALEGLLAARPALPGRSTPEVHDEWAPTPPAERLAQRVGAGVCAPKRVFRSCRGASLRARPLV